MTEPVETLRRMMYAPKALMKWSQLGTGVGIDLPDSISGSIGFIPVFPDAEAIRQVYPNIDLETQTMKLPVIRVARPMEILDEQKETQEAVAPENRISPAT